MTNGTQAQADESTAGRALPPAVQPPAKRPPLAVIPRRATGTHTAIPAMDTTPPTGVPAPTALRGAPTEQFGPPVAAQQPEVPPMPPAADPAGVRSRRIRAASAAAVLVVLAVAGLLWVVTDGPDPDGLSVAPVAAEVLPPAPPSAAAPAAPAPPADESAGAEAGGEAVGDDVVRPEDWMPDGGLPESVPTTGLPQAPAGAEPTAAPGAQPTAAPPTAGDPAPGDPAGKQPPRRDDPTVAPPVRGRANADGRNLALNRPIFASSFANRLRAPGQAVDGSLLSRWSTRFTNPQWLAVDLGDTWRISRVRIAWELAYADTYRVDLSTDGRAWTPVWQTRAGLGGTVGVPIDGAAARYVRVYGVKPAGPFGFSIRELDVR